MDAADKASVQAETEMLISNYYITLTFFKREIKCTIKLAYFIIKSPRIVLTSLTLRIEA